MFEWQLLGQGPTAAPVSIPGSLPGAEDRYRRQPMVSRCMDGCNSIIKNLGFEMMEEVWLTVARQYQREEGQSSFPKLHRRSFSWTPGSIEDWNLPSMLRHLLQIGMNIKSMMQHGYDWPDPPEIITPLPSPLAMKSRYLTDERAAETYSSNYK